jgi:hypothetical protein
MYRFRSTLSTVRNGWSFPFPSRSVLNATAAPATMMEAPSPIHQSAFSDSVAMCASYEDSE